MSPSGGQQGASDRDREQPATVRLRAPQRMQMRYGFNEVDGWWHIGLGPHRETIRRHRG